MKKNDLIPLLIDRFNEKGHGIAFCNDKKISVPYALPTENVEVILLKKKRSEWEAKLKNRLNESYEREAFKCPHAGICGGCQWQHLNYEAQLKQKQKWICDLFSFSGSKVLPIVGCDSLWNYRNKMEYSFSQSKEGDKFLGLLRQGSQRVENIKECHLAPQWFSDCVNLVREWWIKNSFLAFNPRRGEGLLRTLTLRESVHTCDRMIILTVSFDPACTFLEEDKSSFLKALEQIICDPNYNTTVIVKTHVAIKGQPTTFKEEILYGKGFIVEELKINSSTLKFKISPDAFFQPNPKQAQKLFEKALELSNVNEADTILDLYSGTGVLGLVASLSAKEVIGIELNSAAVKDADQNINLNNTQNFKMIEGDVGSKLKELNLYSLSSLTIFVDPPRTGLNQEAIDQISSLLPEKIVYISCNPRTQAPNIAAFLEKGFYVETIQPVDQFPHTYHIENIVVLKKII